MSLLLTLATVASAQLTQSQQDERDRQLRGVQLRVDEASALAHEDRIVRNAVKDTIPYVNQMGNIAEVLLTKTTAQLVDAKLARQHTANNLASTQRRWDAAVAEGPLTARQQVLMERQLGRVEGRAEAAQLYENTSRETRNDAQFQVEENTIMKGMVYNQLGRTQTEVNEARKIEEARLQGQVGGTSRTV